VEELIGVIEGVFALPVSLHEAPDIGFALGKRGTDGKDGHER